MKDLFLFKEKVPAVLIYGCLACLGLFLVFVGILFSQENMLHRKRAMKVSGQVVSFVSEKRNLSPQIEFVDPTTQKMISFSPRVFSFYQPFKKGDQVNVFYSPQTQKILVDDWLLSFSPGIKSILWGVLLSGIGLLAILIIFIHSFFNPID